MKTYVVVLQYLEDVRREKWKTEKKREGLKDGSELDVMSSWGIVINSKS